VPGIEDALLPSMLHLLCRIEAGEALDQVLARFEMGRLPVLRVDPGAEETGPHDAGAATDLWISRDDVLWARGALWDLLEDPSIHVAAIRLPEPRLAVSRLRLDLSDPDAEAFCTRCSTCYSRPLDRCGLCGGAALTREVILERLDRSVPGPTSHEAPEPLLWFCRLRATEEENEMASRLREAKVPHLVLPVPPETDRPDAEARWVDFLLLAPHLPWAWAHLGELASRGPAVWVASANELFEVLDIGTDLEDAGLCWTEIRMIPQYPFYYGELGETDVLVPEKDLERACEALETGLHKEVEEEDRELEADFAEARIERRFHVARLWVALVGAVHTVTGLLLVSGPDLALLYGFLLVVLGISQLVLAYRSLREPRAAFGLLVPLAGFIVVLSFLMVLADPRSVASLFGAIIYFLAVYFSYQSAATPPRAEPA
jgi:hypothetical protein